MIVRAQEPIAHGAFVAVMPEGVEHTSATSAPAADAMAFVAVMPEGVEHPHTHQPATFASKAFVAVMPEGVEHADDGLDEGGE